MLERCSASEVGALFHAGVRLAGSIGPIGVPFLRDGVAVLQRGRTDRGAAMGVRMNPPPGWPTPPEGWTPPPGWTPDPAWPAPPYGWVLWKRTPAWPQRAFGWFRVGPETAVADARAKDRRPPGIEILLVLGIFPLGSAIVAVASLVQQHVEPQTTISYYRDLFPDRPLLSALFNFALIATSVIPAFLALYLLRLSGGGGSVLGLTRSGVRGDLSRMGKLFLYAWIGPFVIVGLALHRSGVKPPVTLPGSRWFLVPFIASAVVAGVVEEIVVLGYLAWRLQQRGWPTRQIVLLATTVRVSYHLYYGWSALAVAVWGALSVFLFLRRPRLLPFIIIHVVWDTVAFIGHYTTPGVTGLLVLGEIVLYVVLWLSNRRFAVSENQSTAPTSTAGLQSE